MIELTKYFPAGELELAWRVSEGLSFIETETGIQIFATGFAQQFAELNLPDEDRRIMLSAAKTLGDFMRQGPVIVRPSLILCKAMMDTELNFSTMDYRQPFPIVGVEIPAEITGLKDPSLAVVGMIGPGSMTVWIRDWDSVTTYHTQIGPDLPTIEDRVRHLEWTDTKEEATFFHHVCRVAINVCLLAATRQTKTDQLPENVVKKRRRRGDERVQRLAARQCQEITFRDIVIYDRSKSDESGAPTGVIHGPQHRRGHWKRVAFGPRFSMHRLQWLNDYYTHREIEGEQPAIVMK